MKPLLPGILLRRLTATDIPAADELRAFAGWNQTPRDWQGYLEFEPEGCFAAEFAGRVIGTATTITYGTEVGWIGMVLVHPEHRRAGIGGALLKRSIEYLQSRRIRSIKLDATPMGRKVYLPMGFGDEYELARYEGIADRAPEADISRVEPLANANWEDLVAFDARTFGLPRPAVLQSLAGREPDRCLVVREQRKIRGFLIARDGCNAVQVGPWTAQDPAVAVALLAVAVRRSAGRKMFIDVPSPNVVGADLMHQSGFTVQRGYTRMYLGENPRPGIPAQVFSTSGAEKG